MIPRIFLYLRKLEGNAKICIAFHPFWAIPYSIYFFYVSLYLKERGITDSQLGSLMMVGSICALCFSAISAPIVDMLGRKRTILVFDLLSSVLPPLFFLFANNFALALAAMVFANMNRIMSIGYYLVMIEDCSDESTVVAMNVFNIILVAAGLLTPLAGLIVGRMGIIRAEQLFLAISAASMTFLAIARHTLLSETSQGKKTMDENRRLRQSKEIPNRYWFLHTLTRYLAPYRDAFTYLREYPKALSALTANVLFYSYYAIGTSVSLYFAPYFTDFLQFTGKQISFIGGTYAAGTLIAMTLINPHITKETINKFLVAATILSVTGLIALVLTPIGNLASALIATFITAVAFGMLKTTVDSLLALHTGGGSRTGIYALSFVCSSLLGILVIRICSLLYVRYAGWLFILSAILVSLILVSRLPHGKTGDGGGTHRYS